MICPLPRASDLTALKWRRGPKVELLGGVDGVLGSRLGASDEDPGVILRALSGEIHWFQAAEILGYSTRTMRRYERARAIDWSRVEEMTLALMHLTSFEEHGAVRSWKGHDWEVLNRLHERGWISNPVSKAKSVLLSDEGARRSNELFERHFLTRT